MGPQLYPIVSTGFMVALILAPGFQWIFNKMVNFDGVLYIVGVLTISGGVALLGMTADRIPKAKVEGSDLKKKEIVV
jgi:hypothetical protein